MLSAFDILSGSFRVGRVSDVARSSALNKGDPKAAGELLPLVYEELRKLAAQKMAREAPGRTLQPTALVHKGLASADWERKQDLGQSRAFLRRCSGSDAAYPDRAGSRQGETSPRERRQAYSVRRGDDRIG